MFANSSTGNISPNWMNVRKDIHELPVFLIIYIRPILPRINSVRIQVERRGMREGIVNSREWAEIAARKKAIAERA